MTLVNIRERAKRLAAKTETGSITPEEVGQLIIDLAGYAQSMERDGATLGIRKVYPTRDAMQADSNPIGVGGKPLRRGNLVAIYNEDTATTDINSGLVAMWTGDGWMPVARIAKSLLHGGTAFEDPLITDSDLRLAVETIRRQVAEAFNRLEYTAADKDKVDRLKTGGSKTQYLGADGAYHALPSRPTGSGEELEIGGRNLVLKSSVVRRGDNFNIGAYDLSERWVPGQSYTASLRIGINRKEYEQSAESRPVIIPIHGRLSGVRFTELKAVMWTEIPDAEGLYWATFRATFTPSEEYLNQGNEPLISMHLGFNKANYWSYKVAWVKVEKGNVATDYSPAPEDLQADMQTQIAAIPGILAAGTVSAQGTITAPFGAKALPRGQSTARAEVLPDGSYKVYHSIGHRNYSVQLTGMDAARYFPRVIAIEPDSFTCSLALASDAERLRGVFSYCCIGRS